MALERTWEDPEAEPAGGVMDADEGYLVPDGWTATEVLDPASGDRESQRLTDVILRRSSLDTEGVDARCFRAKMMQLWRWLFRLRWLVAGPSAWPQGFSYPAYPGTSNFCTVVGLHVIDAANQTVSSFTVDYTDGDPRCFAGYGLGYTCATEGDAVLGDRGGATMGQVIQVAFDADQAEIYLSNPIHIFGDTVYLVREHWRQSASYYAADRSVWIEQVITDWLPLSTSFGAGYVLHSGKIARPYAAFTAGGSRFDGTLKIEVATDDEGTAARDITASVLSGFPAAGHPLTISNMQTTLSLEADAPEGYTHARVTYWRECATQTGHGGDEDAAEKCTENVCKWAAHVPTTSGLAACSEAVVADGGVWICAKRRNTAPDPIPDLANFAARCTLTECPAFDWHRETFVPHVDICLWLHGAGTFSRKSAVDDPNPPSIGREAGAGLLNIIGMPIWTGGGLAGPQRGWGYLGIGFAGESAALKGLFETDADGYYVFKGFDEWNLAAKAAGEDESDAAGIFGDLPEFSGKSDPGGGNGSSDRRPLYYRAGLTPGYDYESRVGLRRIHAQFCSETMSLSQPQKSEGLLPGGGGGKTTVRKKRWTTPPVTFADFPGVSNDGMTRLDKFAVAQDTIENAIIPNGFTYKLIWTLNRWNEGYPPRSALQKTTATVYSAELSGAYLLRIEFEIGEFYIGKTTEAGYAEVPCNSGGNVVAPPVSWVPTNPSFGGFLAGRQWGLYPGDVIRFTDIEALEGIGLICVGAQAMAGDAQSGTAPDGVEVPYAANAYALKGDVGLFGIEGPHGAILTDWLSSNSLDGASCIIERAAVCPSSITWAGTEMSDYNLKLYLKTALGVGLLTAGVHFLFAPETGKVYLESSAIPEGEFTLHADGWANDHLSCMSAQDLAACEALLEGLVPVGWYDTHKTPSGFAMTYCTFTQEGYEGGYASWRRDYVEAHCFAAHPGSGYSDYDRDDLEANPLGQFEGTAYEGTDQYAWFNTGSGGEHSIDLTDPVGIQTVPPTAATVAPDAFTFVWSAGGFTVPPVRGATADEIEQAVCRITIKNGTLKRHTYSFDGSTVTGPTFTTENLLNPTVSGFWVTIEDAATKRCSYSEAGIGASVSNLHSKTVGSDIILTGMLDITGPMKAAAANPFPKSQLVLIIGAANEMSEATSDPVELLKQLVDTCSGNAGGTGGFYYTAFSTAYREVAYDEVSLGEVWVKPNLDGMKAAAPSCWQMPTGFAHPPAVTDVEE